MGKMALDKIPPMGNMAGMELPTIAELESRAGRIGLSIRELCDAADISISTYYRWRGGEAVPLLDGFERLVKAVESAEGQQPSDAA